MNRRLVLILMPAVLLAAAGMSAQPVEQEKVTSAPRLIWEKEFPVPSITAVGVDEEYFARSGDIEGSLKWLLSGRSMYRVWWGGLLLVGPALGDVRETCISPDGNRFVGILRISVRGPWDGLCCRAMCLSGLDSWILRWHIMIFSALIRDDGSAVLASGLLESFEKIHGLHFIDRRGLLRRTYKLNVEQWSGLQPGMISRDYFALGDYSPDRGNKRASPFGLSPATAEVCLFDRVGTLLWRRRAGRGWVQVAVSDSGDVLATVDRTDSGYGVALVFDREGTVRDSVRLRLTGIQRSLEIDGGLAFVSTGGYGFRLPSADGGFMCYDLEANRVRFLLNAEDEYMFREFDVNTRSGHVAVLKRFGGRRSARWMSDGAIVVYDFDGQQKTELPIRLPWLYERPAWFKLLDGALLVAEGNKLRLYEIDVE